MEAKSAALKGPPPVLERIVLLCLPLAVRETVGGDLCEMYRTPLQYGSQALCILPFVVASQIRRNANLPLLVLQGLIFFAGFGGLFAVTAPDRSNCIGAILATAAALFFFFCMMFISRRDRPRAGP